jgi:hypothetical protein
MTMQQKKNFQSPPVTISRRTGLDRRWITSAGHQPERRRGGDRRTQKKRSFTEPLALVDPQEKSVALVAVDPDLKTPKPVPARMSTIKEWTPPQADAKPTRDTPEDE